MSELKEIEIDENEASELYEHYQNSKPQFASLEEAKAAYGKELERLASDRGIKIEALVKDADENWTDASARILHLANFLFYIIF